MGVTADNGPDELTAALARTREEYTEVMIERRARGDDLRLVVIDGRVVAAALRMPPQVVGTGEHTVRDLIGAESRQRSGSRVDQLRQRQLDENVCAAVASALGRDNRVEQAVGRTSQLRRSPGARLLLALPAYIAPASQAAIRRASDFYAFNHV
ncbi:hypothetical protein MGAST_28505 [Mycobacterium gastri 'Wayne']|uniref:Uncharacterized protein n=1 Tax=Mycobacterium gastri TaxID=1777 RepID=A0A1X1V2F2_MYCGS|nr:hypothetical protein MGAST_28505 [Mycobacterium gastri 'Wayne']ORV63243.1 hypothetical protein AWC07_16045 [Mycobacterium gastri]